MSFDVAGGAEPAPMIVHRCGRRRAIEVLVVAADRHATTLWNFLNDQGLAHAVAFGWRGDAKSSLITNLETIFRDDHLSWIANPLNL